MRFGTWNIKTLNGKEVEIAREMEKYRLELLGLEISFILRYSGVPAINRATEGVGVIMSDEPEKKSHQLEPS
jgi:hypothetical protein